MKDFVVEYLNKEQFLDVANYYNWGNYVANCLSEETHCIYVRNAKPNGWDNDSRCSTKSTYSQKLSYNEWCVQVGKEPIKELVKPTSNMKYVVEVNNQQEADAVYVHINGSASLRALNYPCVITSNKMYGSVHGHKKADMIQKYGPIISFKTFSEMFDIKPLKADKTLKLTSEYSAVVNYNTNIVQVGCQSIPFSIVEDLAQLIKE